MGEMESASSIGQELYNAASNYAERKGYHFGPGADAAIESFAEEAAAKIEAKAAKSGESEGALVDQSMQAFARLIDEMIAASHEIEGYKSAHPNAIGEETLARAMSRLCPLWPIC